jgi:DNA-binding response OmpR family regulator
MRRILIVEDEERLCLALVAYLRSQGAHPIVTTTAQEALGLLEEDKVDLMVLDLNLVGGTGLEVLKHIRGSSHLADLPVLVMSAWDMEPACYDYLEPGDYVTKPFDMRLLELVIRQYLEFPQAPSPRESQAELSEVAVPDDGHERLERGGKSGAAKGSEGTPRFGWSKYTDTDN